MGKIKNLPDMEQPREKAIVYGIRSLSNRELLAILLRCGLKDKNVLQIADDVLNAANGIKKLPLLSVSDLKKIRGISSAKALELLAVFELNRRISYEEVREGTVICSPEVLFEWLKREIGYHPQEEFIAVFLNHVGYVIGYQLMFVGTSDKSLVSTKDIFREAIQVGASAMVVAHNHPGGSLNPSNADILMTKRLSEVGKLMNIEVLDHIIVTNDECISLKREGFFSEL